jgi:hypothetical protein
MEFQAKFQKKLKVAAFHKMKEYDLRRQKEIYIEKLEQTSLET